MESRKLAVFTLEYSSRDGLMSAGDNVLASYAFWDVRRYNDDAQDIKMGYDGNPASNYTDVFGIVSPLHAPNYGAKAYWANVYGIVEGARQWWNPVTPVITTADWPGGAQDNGLSIIAAVSIQTILIRRYR